MAPSLPISGRLPQCGEAGRSDIGARLSFFHTLHPRYTRMARSAIRIAPFCSSFNFLVAPLLRKAPALQSETPYRTSSDTEQHTGGATMLFI